MTGSALDSQVQARRAIEALRAGVPNRDAVLALGSSHAQIEEQFGGLLAEAKEQPTVPRNPAGFLIAGNFGTGKSHELEYLQQIALREGFVASKVVISKETPLYDPVKVYRAAIQAATVPGRVGAALAQIAGELKFDDPRYLDFYRWVQGPTAALNQRFAATLYLFERTRHDPELRDRIISFWSGDPIQVGEIRSRLKDLGQRVTYPIERAGVRALAYQRFRFAAQLMVAAGYADWVLLFDEVDLIARYTLIQRGRSYAEIARWTGNLKEETYPGLSSVLAITSAFEAEVIDGRNDREAVPGKLLLSGNEYERVLAGPAERGMKLIGRALRLSPPNAAILDETYTKVRAIHGRAYGWEPPPVDSRGERLASTRMREYVRRWINEW
ncbi:MAG TPA: BREX system ATP-binding domain-containing protein, partial [Thermomicrobiales bacterium]|nr:BREX system ATP-binding domain-containing protein [Thermomicrobiales bacterium]